MFNKTSQYLVLVILTIMSSASLYMSYQALKKDMYSYKEETKCISVLVSQGIERKDITIEDGVCVVEENIYYKSLNK